MKLTPQTRLPPAPEQIEALEATLRALNAAADVARRRSLRTAHRQQDRAPETLPCRSARTRFGLSAQMAVRRIAQVCEAYKRDKSIRPQFQPFAAMPFDQRLVSFKWTGPRLAAHTLRADHPAASSWANTNRPGSRPPRDSATWYAARTRRWFPLATQSTCSDGTPLAEYRLHRGRSGSDEPGPPIASATAAPRVEASRRHYHDQRRSLQQAAGPAATSGAAPVTTDHPIASTESNPCT
ncbi:MAG: hypothetical protein MZV65_06550 [Chromatiales bacterium]|nr:hypothetical protein [Chromatiales bacterium]